VLFDTAGLQGRRGWNGMEWSDTRWREWMMATTTKLYVRSKRNDEGTGTSVVGRGRACSACIMKTNSDINEMNPRMENDIHLGPPVFRAVLFKPIRSSSVAS